MDSSYKPPKSNKDIAEWVVSEFEKWSSSRSTFESQWREIAELTDPAGPSSFNANGQYINPGEKRTSKILDTTAVNAVNRLAAIMDSLLTPRSQIWHSLGINDKKIAANRDVALWFEQVNQILFNFRYEPTANFSSQNQKDYKNLGRYGTSGLFIDDFAEGPGLRYKSISIGQLFFSENHQGLVDRVIRRFQLSCRQAVDKWGDKCPETIRNCSDQNRMFVFLHKVCPRIDDFDPERRDHKGKPFASYYVSVEGKELLSEGGYTSFPYAISRYEQSEDEVYGRSPMMEVLPAIKTLNEQKKILLKQGHKALDPTLLIHDDGILNGFSLKPGALNYGGVSADGRPLVHALPVGNVQVGKEMMDEERSSIKDASMENLFQILLEGPAKTATEVMELSKEKGILIAPTLGRLQSERLGPMIDRELDALSVQGLIPPMPDLLREAKGNYQVRYDSPLNRTARAEEASGLMRALEAALQVVNATQDPSPLDYFDFDTAIPEIARIQGVPERFFKSVEDVMNLRKGRAQNAATDKLIQAGPAAAAIMKAGAPQ